MNAMDKFTDLKKIKDGMSKHVWSANGGLVQGLQFSHIERPWAYVLSNKEHNLLAEAVQQERMAIGDSIRLIFLCYCDKELKKLAKQAEQEAKAVLEALE